MTPELGMLRSALLDLTGVLNSPQPDAALIAAAGVDLDRALFPLVMRIEHGPVGVVELAQLCGRDYTTVSRQVRRLEALGLASRRIVAGDRRQRQVTLTAKGRRVTASLDAARGTMLSKALTGWSRQDLRQLARLLRRFADDAMAWTNR